MEKEFILIPLLVQVLLTISLYVSLAVFKKRAVASNEVDEERRALHDDAWPEYVIKINNCIRNQFEVPVLFYVLVFSHISINAVNTFPVILSWLFVISRIFHAYIHTGSNYVPTRRKVFMLGVGIILLLSINLSIFLF